MTGIQGVNYGYQASPKFCGQDTENKKMGPIAKGTIIGAGTGAVVGGGLGTYLGLAMKSMVKSGGEEAIRSFESMAGCSVNSAFAKVIGKFAVYGAIPCAIGGLVIGAIVKACSGNKDKA